MDTLIIIKLICLFVGIFYSFTNITRMYYKASIPFANLFWWAIGITGFIIIQFNLY